MDVHLNTLSDWAVKSLCETFFVPCLSSLGEMPALPLPSVAEILLCQGDPTCSAYLPSPVANRIIDGLARRGKLTASILDILLDRNRVRLTTLPLYCLANVDPNAIVSKIGELVDVTSIDISFSPCLADLSTPFLKIVEDKCKKSLISFSTRHVIGDIGLVELPHFSNLKHLDVGFTSLSREELGTVVSSAALLERLCISGISVSLFEVFSTADCLACVGLKHLGLNSLNFVPVTDSEFTQALHSKISAFFSKLAYLNSVDFSYVSWCGDRESGRALVKQALYEIVTSTPSLTYLDSSGTLSLYCVCDVLRATNRFSQLKVLENLTEWDYDLGAENCQISIGKNVDDYRSKHALRNYASFCDALTRYDDTVLWRRLFRRREAFPAPLSSMLYAGLLRMQTEKDFKMANIMTNFFDALDKKMAFDYERNREPVFLSRQACSLLEFAFQHLLNPNIFSLIRDYRDGSRRDKDRFVKALLSTAFHLPTSFCSNPLLLHLALAVIDSVPDDSALKCNTLRKFFRRLPAASRQHLAINKSYLSKLCDRLSYFLGCYCEIERIRYKWFCLYDFVFEAYATVRALGALCHGVPNLFRHFVGVPEAVDNLAEVALRGSYYYLYREYTDVRVDEIYWAAIECLSYIAEIRDLAHSVCSPKVIKAIVDSASCSPTERMRFSSSYLVGLLIVNDELDSIWPHDVQARNALVAKVFDNSENKQGFCERTTEYCCYLYTTLMPLVKLCSCSQFPVVSTFGLNHLAYFCSSAFDPQEYFAQTGLCPLCLMRKEVGADVVSGLSLPAELKDQFEAVMMACPVHKEG